MIDEVFMWLQCDSVLIQSEFGSMNEIVEC